MGAQSYLGSFAEGWFREHASRTKMAAEYLATTH